MEKNILEQLSDYARQRVDSKKGQISLDELKDIAYALTEGEGGVASFDELPFYKAIAAPGMSFICECKKASPSKGVIAEDYPYLDIAREYDAAGASAISVLTEPKWFLGSEMHLAEITRNVSIPVLRKDFVVDEYMIFEAKAIGASAVLLITEILDEETLTEFIRICGEVNLTPLVEAHTKEQIDKAVRAGARIIGVNNRDLRDFSVDINNSIALRDMVPEGILFVAESGIKEHSEVEAFAKAGASAVLIGETMMRASDKGKMLASLKGDL